MFAGEFSPTFGGHFLTGLQRAPLAKPRRSRRLCTIGPRTICFWQAAHSSGAPLGVFSAPGLSDGGLHRGVATGHTRRVVFADDRGTWGGLVSGLPSRKGALFHTSFPTWGFPLAAAGRQRPSPCLLTRAALRPRNV